MENRQFRRHAAKTRARVVQGHLSDARKALADGDAREAELACRAAVDADPLAAAPYHLQAQIAYMGGRLAEAGELILEAATRDDDDIDIHADCGAIMNMLGRPAEAEAACRQVLEKDQRHVGAWNNLSVALDIQGRYDEALQAADEALARNPGFTDALVNKGSILVKTEQPVAAIETLAEAVARAPNHPLARVNLATALRKVGEFDAALGQCQAALDLQPDYAEAHGALGDVHAAAGAFEDAIAAYDRALECRPGFMAVRLNRAAALHKAGRHDEAIAGYRAVLQDFPESADAYAGLGVVQLALGDLTDAAASLRKATELNPKQGSAWAALAASPEAAISDNDIEALTGFCDDRTVALDVRIDAHFALGEIFDRKGDQDAAFTHFSAGNEGRRAQMAARDLAFDPESLAAETESIIENHPAGALSGVAGSADERPVFVVGMPRSGTTLVEQILAAHPRVSGAGEAMSIAALDPGMGDAQMAEAAINRLLETGGDADRIVDKTPFQFRDLGLIRRLFPNARIIHCRRDALNTGLSCFMQNFVEDYPWSCDLEHIGHFLNAYRRLMAHWREVLLGGLLEVDYEDLTSDPEAAIRRLIDFAGLEWDSACLAFHEVRRPVLSASNWQVRQPMYASSVGRASPYGAHLDPLRRVLAAGE
jgi:tetratricopeptide (TPR) repeat protein